MLHAPLKRLNPTVFFIIESAMNRFIKAAGCNVRLDTLIDKRRMALVKPQVQFVQLLRRERIYGAFNFLDGA